MKIYIKSFGNKTNNYIVDQETDGKKRKLDYLWIGSDDGTIGYIDGNGLKKLHKALSRILNES